MSKTNLNKYLSSRKSFGKYRRIGTHKRAGVVVPLFSVYSQNSIAIGDLEDLKLLIDWAKLTRNSIIQLLPINEVGSLSCPYEPISSFAFEPLYLCLRTMPAAKNKSIEDRMKHLEGMFPKARARIDYALKQEKLQLLWEIYKLDNGGDSEQLKKFKEENAYWLPDFALYKTLKSYHKSSAWYDWQDQYRQRDRAALENFQKEHEREIGFQIWIQWQLYRQVTCAKTHAQSNRILLKGDLPLLVSLDSADVWAHPEFFKLEFAAGAPPDMYCAKGQRWGMPTYNWDNIIADDYRYLKEKLRYAQQFYDILRIDHVIGLFRIWSIPCSEPLENKGLSGFFDPREESVWEAQGRKILSVMLENTTMLLCAEDLGIIPKMCPKVLKEFGIPGNDVQRWVKDWKKTHDFLKPQDYRALTVAMLSTHDTTNWPAWWENEAGTVDEDLFIRKCSDHRKINFDNVKDKLFDARRSGHGRLRWSNSIDSVEKLVSILGKPKEELADFIDIYENTYKEKEKLWGHLGINGTMREGSDPEVVRQALKITLESSAIFCINTLIDYLYLTDIFKGDPYQYRINMPSTISAENWSLTIPISLEELLEHKINKDIRQMIKSSGRI